ncbi:hypothetical protein QBC35DRAFT_93447 [Podospora australis]|uniref:Uncharacterized protein n=1 Tax=Podospora australis TaxID=1536484 RepID=A0AAN7ACI5_9PEZI|nr:hypothetical protein QBC35DRAFT_93447 [Podospora australis]
MCLWSFSSFMFSSFMFSSFMFSSFMFSSFMFSSFMFSASSRDTCTSVQSDVLQGGHKPLFNYLRNCSNSSGKYLLICKS